MAAAPTITKVVNLRYEPYDVYIGRANRSRGLRESKWASPFIIGAPDPEDHNYIAERRPRRKITRARSVALYKDYILSRPDLVQDCKRFLKGKRLGCWCKPLDCHGEILVGIAEGLIETPA